jgi:hypothetical protein
VAGDEWRVMSAQRQPIPSLTVRARWFGIVTVNSQHRAALPEDIVQSLS